MSALAAPEAVTSIVNRMASIQYQIENLTTRPATTTGSATAAITGGDGTTPKAGTTAAAFATTLTQAVRQATTAIPAAAPTAAAAVPATSNATSGPDGDDVIAAAKKYLGIPYVWGGTSNSGLDCSGLVQRTFADVGIDLPRVSRDQAKSGTPVASLAEAQPGDLVAFGSPVDHIAIYLGNNQILEAPQPGKNVQITEMYRTPTAIRRIVPGGDGTAVTGIDGAAGRLAATPAGNGADTDGTGSPDVETTTKLGIPPSLLARFDPAQLAGVPRAIPASALGVTEIADMSDAITMVQQFAANTGDDVAGGSAAGLDASRLTAAGLSDAVAAFADQFAAAEQQYRLPHGVLAAMAQVESGGRTDAVSSAGAQGLMQLMPATAAALGVTDPTDPAQAIRGAAQYLSDNLSAFDGSLTKALAAYNAGPGAVRQYGGVPPYAETQNYVQKITDLLARLT